MPVKTSRLCASVLFLYVAIMPIMSLARGFVCGDVDTDSFFDGLHIEDIEDTGEYEKVAEEAFIDGIRQLLFTKYGIKEENARVFVFDFDFEKMTAGKIKIFLSKRGALADWRGIEEYITESGLGTCEVEIE